ncbi:hypothetical protein KPL78_12400 [Roseomonas sp. HJA6]|uniref:Uncharacterized protein n=2 Tax=Roseomonas alba TaxID=2846776 RepID=A0ABS7AA56_9PROT|nr:hypothetical protein [Neoroseomonas alba]
MIRSAQEQEQIEARVDHQVAMIGIQRDNERAGNQAAADANAGRPADPAMSEQRVYRETFAAVSGQRQGFALADRWRSEVYDRTPIGGDLRAATDEWLRSTVGRGSGDPTFDRHAMDVLSRAVDRGMASHRDEGARAVTEQGAENLRGLIGRAVSSGDWTPDDIGRWTSTAAVLNRGDRNRAQAFVTGAIEQAVRTGDEAGAQRLLTALQQEGSGREGRSWRADNEQAYVALEGRLMERVRHTRTVAGQAAYNQIEDRIAQARTPGELVALQEDIERVHGQYGGVEDRQRVQRALATRLGPLVRQQEHVNQIREWAAGAGSPDPSVVRQHIDAFLATVPTNPQDPSAGQGIGIANAPERTGTLVARLGAVSDTMGAQLRTLLADTANPDGQAAAIRFLRTVEGARGGSRDFALTLIPEEHRGAYRVISDMLTSTNLPVERVVERIGALGGNDVERNLHETTWQRLYPREDNQAKAEERMRRQIAQGLREHVGNSGSFWSGNTAITVDGALQGALEANAHTAAVYARQIGADVDQAVRGSIRDLQGRVDLLPLPDGSARAVLRRDGVGRDGTVTPVHADGAPRVRGGINVRNPATGRDENTLETAREDMQMGAQVFNGLVADGGRLGLGDDPRMAAMGLRPVVHSGNRDHISGAVVLQGGDEVDLGGERVRLPTNPEEAARIITERIRAVEGRPQDAGGYGGTMAGTNGSETRFRIIPEQTAVNGQSVTLYRLAYRFGFRDRQITAEERAAMHQNRNAAP